VFLPVRLSFAARFDQGAASPLGFVVRLWGIRILSFPRPRSRRSSWIGRKLSRWIESLLSPSDKPEDGPVKPPKASKPLRPGFLFWAAGRGMNLVSSLTRRLEVGCGGIDPALLGTLTGVAAIAQGALGTKKFRWNPDFAPGAMRLDLKWTLSISAWKLVVWTGETFSDRNRQPRKPAGFVVSHP